MIHPPSVVAIDDRPDELGAIVKALRSLDVACLPILVNGSTPDIARPLTGVRLVFFDINYLPAGVPETAMYEVAATVLGSVVDRENGPYMLITWSSKSDQHNALMAHFASQIQDLPVPAMSACLPKEKFLYAGMASGAIASGVVEVPDEESQEAQQAPSAAPEGAVPQAIETTKPDQDENQPSAEVAASPAPAASEEPSGDWRALRDEIKRMLDEHPQLAALMQWELTARRAAGDVVNSILNLFSRSERFNGSCGPELEKILTHIASSAVGKGNIEKDRRAAISEALTPILYDRLTHLPPSPDEAALWSQAMPLAEPKVASVNPSHGAKLNLLSLVALPGSEPMEPGGRGAVFQLDEGVENYFMQRTGWSSKVDLVREFLEVSEGGKLLAPTEAHLTEDFRWVLIGTRATCDQAQGRGLMSPAVLALEVPASLRYGEKSGLRIRKHGASMLTPPFSCPTKDGKPFKDKRLVLNWHWVVSVGPKDLASAAVLYRLREPLINQISSTKSSYQARPAIVSFTQEDL